MNRITAVILAGGKSQRMTYDKQEIELREGRLIEKLVYGLDAIFDRVLVVTNRPQLYGDLPCNAITDIHPGHGPISGLHAALTYSPTELVYLLACDMPNLNPAFIQYMVDCYEDVYDGVMTREGEHIEPMNALYHRRLLPLVEKQIEAASYRIFHLAEKANFLYISQRVAREFSREGDMYYNINTIADLEDYEGLAMKKQDD